MKFKNYICIDYSGAEHSDARLSGLQVCMATRSSPPERQYTNAQHWNCTRRELSNWICHILKTADAPTIIGIDHCFSFPQSYMIENNLSSWDCFLEQFNAVWPLREPQITVDTIRHGANPPAIGSNTALRLTEKWTSSARSVFLFDVQGSVAKSSFTGIAWLKYIRDQFPDRSKVHFWPFDGWTPHSGAHVICEVYPSIFRNRYNSNGLNEHARDAFVVASWLKDIDGREGAMERYFSPVLTNEEKRVASVEGWILGV